MSRPILLGVPFDASSSYLRGAAEAPPLIRAALRSPATNTWSELGVDTDEAAGGLLDAGDLDVGETPLPLELIAARVAAVSAGGHVPVVLGGDHAITFPVVKGLQRAMPVFDILHIDAHPDLYDELDGDRLSHACPFARIMEAGLARRLVQVGIRGMNGHQRAQARRFGADVIDMRRWAAGDRPSLGGAVYLSVDIDGIDPAFAPGVSHREPGGLSVRDVIGLIHALRGTIVGADVVEFNPRQDPHGMTAWVAAKLVKEIAGTCLTA